ncbi:probable zinc-binding oxidoreductase [Ramularia collo-cygni]|uniref:Probable zinc-binding oxidoreductase n=1 Tax=Ramularia collo-cygni TaxID=112498 RepID=A0A2D3VKS3_9PEZI|nr:probable zinc-binding oxidoreductase [Ramularia collo-cygni]CZT24079.1 probable zinc-binding oxidoreductase [Ramularia collo-cygni]
MGNKSWTINGKTGFEALSFADSPVPEVGDKDVLVKLHGASLNYRDLIIPKGLYPFPSSDGLVPGSDGAGVVEAVGKSVTRFKKGDKVVTLFNQGHLSGSLDYAALGTGLGGAVDGTLRQQAVFNEQGLVHMPKNLNYMEAASLTCAGLTAWNALYGLKQLMPGEWVLTQGTGGVSIFALQFAKAAGAKVIATTSSAAKAETLKGLGADHVINYKEDANWGETAKKLTGGLGVQHVIEVGGPNTQAQSLKAIAFDGIISVIGFIAGAPGETQATLTETLQNLCTVRGILVGSRQQFEAMNRAVEANDIKPVMDKKTFKLEEIKEAYEYMWDQKHFGKIGVQID